VGDVADAHCRFLFLVFCACRVFGTGLGLRMSSVSSLRIFWRREWKIGRASVLIPEGMRASVEVGVVRR
jgi:hypothetical protein